VWRRIILCLSIFLFDCLELAIGTKRQIASWMPDGRFRGKADVEDRAALTTSVVDDPTETLGSKFAAMRKASFPTTVW
jgi:hypothetical protein